MHNLRLGALTARTNRPDHWISEMPVVIWSHHDNFGSSTKRSFFHLTSDDVLHNITRHRTCLSELFWSIYAEGQLNNPDWKLSKFWKRWCSFLPFVNCLLWVPGCIKYFAVTRYNCCSRFMMSADEEEPAVLPGHVAKLQALWDARYFTNVF